MTDWAEERFWAKVEKGEGCWAWRGSRSANGYGRFYLNGRTVAAHRVAFALAGGTLASGEEIDHTCRHKWCVNPTHLDPATRAANLRRHFDRVGVCKRGHPRTVENLKVNREGHRLCAICLHDYSSKRAAERTYDFDGKHCTLCRRPVSRGCRTCDKCRQQQRDRRARRRMVNV